MAAANYTGKGAESAETKKLADEDTQPLYLYECPIGPANPNMPHLRTD